MYLDGGFYDNLPFKMLGSKGYDKLILVRTHARGFTRKIDKNNENIVVISPSDDIGETFIIDAEVSKNNMKLGYYDGLRALRKLKGRRYYVIPTEDKEYFFNLLLSLNAEQISKIKTLLRIPGVIPNRRVLFENIVPRIGALMGLNKNFTYEDLLIGLLESKAEDLQIERFHIYSFEELLIMVRNTSPANSRDEEVLSPIGKIFERFNKEEVILEIANIIF